MRRTIAILVALATLPAFAVPASASSTHNIASNSWAGWAFSGKSISYVEGTFTVPSLYSNAQCGTSASVEVDVNALPSDPGRAILAGVYLSTEQDYGTASSCSTNGSFYTQAYYWNGGSGLQWIPASALPISAGDSISVLLDELMPGKTWGLTIQDKTSGQDFNQMLPYKSQVTSADYSLDSLGGGCNGHLVKGSGGLCVLAPVASVGFSVQYYTDKADRGKMTGTTEATLKQNGNLIASPTAVKNRKFTINYVSVP